MKRLIILALIFVSFEYLYAQSSSDGLLLKEYGFSRTRENGIHYYKMQTDVINISPDGKKTTRDVYTLYLAVSLNDGKGDKYDITCKKFFVNLKSGGIKALPGLNDWKYSFNKTSDSRNEKGEVFGINHDKFENLKDENGNEIPVESSYLIYNSFIDFHALMNAFSEKSPGGKGIQNLKKIGDRVVHDASYSQPPVNLGKRVKEGSYFKNGEIVLSFKGLSVVNGNPAAIVNYDSGESSFYMKTMATDKIDAETNGRSHYLGDIYINISSLWPVKVELSEFVVSETKIISPPIEIHASVERTVVINEISKEEYENNSPRWIY